MGNIGINSPVMIKKGDDYKVMVDGNFNSVDKKIFFGKPDNENKPAYTSNLKNIFSNSVFDSFPNHNQTLDAFDEAKKNGLINNEPKTLIHVDTHSDIYRKDYKDENIANYVNRFVADGSVKEVYWVAPDESKGGAGDIWNPNIDESVALVSGPKDETIYVDKKTNEMTFQKPDNYEKQKANYREVAFHKRLLNELPSFNGDKNLLLDIDADYFANSGSDTSGHLSFNPNKQELQNKLDKFVTTLNNKGIQPVLTTAALSPEYTSPDSQPAMTNFFEEIGKNSKTDDLLIGYRHDNLYGLDEKSKGKNILRTQKPEYMYSYDLSNIDSHTKDPDGVIVLNEKNPEYKQAVEYLAKKYKINNANVSKILNNLDKLDGNLDGVVNMKRFEELVQAGLI